MFKKTLKTVLSIALIIYVGVIYLLFAMAAGGSSTYPLFFKLILLPFLFVLPFFRALDEKNESLRIRFFIGSFILPIFGSMLMFWGTISEKLTANRERNEILKEYQLALTTTNEDPGRAFLACFQAKFYEYLDCSRTLQSISDAKFCRTLCPTMESPKAPNPQVCQTHRSELLRACADILIAKMDSKAPYDACKHAGLINYQGPAGLGDFAAGYTGPSPDKYFQGFYIWCLESLVKDDRDGELKPLSEVLKINTKKLPVNTPKPLPEN